jgi:hypothetical protein
MFGELPIDARLSLDRKDNLPPGRIFHNGVPKLHR